VSSTTAFRYFKWELSGVPDFNLDLAESEINKTISAALESVAAKNASAPRPYLGASIVGDPCARKVQFDWWCTPFLTARVRFIFDRGHAFEALMRDRLSTIGFYFAAPESLKFTAFGGLVEGHADGVVIRAPSFPGLYLPTPYIWECKALNNKNWRAVPRDGLEKAFVKFSVQVLLYQHFLNKLNPALYTAINADTCETLHFAVPYEAVRAQKAIERVEMIIEATRRGDLLERAYDNPDDWRCKLCGHRAKCWGLADAIAA
jgi:hypothetical protein